MPDEFDSFFDIVETQSKDTGMKADMGFKNSDDDLSDSNDYWDIENEINNTSYSSGDADDDDDEDDDIQVKGDGSQSEDERQRSLKKIAIFALGLAAALLILVCIIARIVSNSKAAESKLNSSYNSASQETVVSKKEPKKENTNNSTKETQAVNNTQSNTGDWVKVKANTFGTIDTQINSIFTVTGVDTYAKVLANGEIQIKTEATGNIAGLTGTYVLDIPFNVTGVVGLGQQLSIVYSIGEKDGSKIVGDIKLTD